MKKNVTNKGKAKSISRPTAKKMSGRVPLKSPASVKAQAKREDNGDC